MKNSCIRYYVRCASMAACTHPYKAVHRGIKDSDRVFAMKSRQTDNNDNDNDTQPDIPLLNLPTTMIKADCNA
jgi:hypothetical protein